MLEKKGDIAATLAGNSNRIELQGAYALKNNQGAVLNFGVFPRKGDSKSNGGSGSLLELGYGYFKPVNKNWRFETYGLAGLGGVENHFPSTVDTYQTTDGKISASMLKFSIQPAIGYCHKNFQVIFSSRFSSLNYSNIKGNLIFNKVNQQDLLYRYRSNFLFEPALTLRLGAENFKVQAQYLWSYNMTRGDLGQEKNMLTLGFFFKFGQENTK